MSGQPKPKKEPTTSRPVCCGVPMPDAYKWRHLTIRRDDGVNVTTTRTTILFFRCPTCLKLKVVPIKPNHGDL